MIAPPPERVIPLADAPGLRRLAVRTARVRALLAAGLLLLLVACFAAARSAGSSAAGTARPEPPTVVVADLSSSIHPAAYAQMAEILSRLARPDRRVGLIVFSDTAYEMLPPGTRGDELRPLLRFFSVRRAGALQSLEARAAGYLDSPWAGGFSSGTRISAGLRLARRALARDGVRGASVLLLSDLEDLPRDLPIVTQEARRYRRAGIGLRIVPIYAGARNVAVFLPLAGRAVETGPVRPAELTRRGGAGIAAPLVAACLALLLLVAGNEHACRPLGWRRV